MDERLHVGRLRQAVTGGLYPMSILLDDLHAKGLAAAQAHFDTLLECIHAVLPEGVKDTIPKTLEDVGGLFSASTKEFYLMILHNTPGYESLNVVFEYRQIRPTGVIENGIDPMGWCFKKFCVMIGGGGMFGIPKEYVAMNIHDALVISKQIADYRDKYAAETPAIPSFPDIPTAKPN